MDDDEAHAQGELADIEISDLQERITAALVSLREIEAHHAELNGRFGRPEGRSKTLRLTRKAISVLEGVE